jgi:ADP-ribose pyrophosphatase YjhB (NUDIX family)
MPRLTNRYFDIDLDSSLYPDDQAVKSIIQEEQAWVERVKTFTTDDVKKARAGVWLTVPMRQIRLVAEFLDHGYKMHHATKEYLKLTKAEDDSVLPKYATHRLRVECLVIDDTSGYCLCVKERFGERYSGCKLVTGGVNVGESIGDAAEREVFEETRIKARFVGTLGHEHRIKTRFDTDELIFGCFLIAEGDQMPVKDNMEIIWAEWQSWEYAIENGNEMMHRWLDILATDSGIHYPSVMPDFRRGKRMLVYLPKVDRRKVTPGNKKVDYYK